MGDERAGNIITVLWRRRHNNCTSRYVRLRGKSNVWSTRFDYRIANLKCNSFGMQHRCRRFNEWTCNGWLQIWFQGRPGHSLTHSASHHWSVLGTSGQLVLYFKLAQTVIFIFEEQLGEEGDLRKTCFTEKSTFHRNAHTNNICGISHSQIFMIKQMKRDNEDQYK